jgi:DNA polymerase epsilon subunit 3
MPPRKSTASAPAVEEESPAPKSVTKESRDDTLGVEVGAHQCVRSYRTNTSQDLNLPKSIVQRLAKGVLPPNTQIQKDALLAMSKSATVFVNYITSWYVAVHNMPLISPNISTIALQNKPSAQVARP